MNRKKLAIAVPASVISDTPHLREKTSKIGLIGRAAAVFRVDEIIVYPDNAEKGKQRNEADLIALLLAYLETPQYLRKRFFKIDPRLQYAGILPPLRTPHHPLNRKAKNLKVGEYREGVTVSKTKEGVLVDIGVERPALMRETNWALGKRLTLQVVKAGERVEVQAVSRDEVPSYWGYTVTVENHSFGRLVENGKFDLTIATSKIGAKFVDVAGKMAEKWKKADCTLVAFGAPARGLHEIVADEGADLNDVADFVVNMVPEQGTETVRTEEALFASLAVLNVQFSW
ncbi:RNA-binding protein [Candidatus Bathyarchaeota archaeon]|nr:RNA-binding protein [Candidatus Bathyarchaeota archaeon]